MAELADVPLVELAPGVEMPQLGLGVWQIPDQQAADIVAAAIRTGYRSIDTARVYENEPGVGEGIRRAGVPRDELFVTTKLWNSSHGRDKARRAFERSLERLGLETVDLYLIHWPTPRLDLYVETWQALVELQREGRARAVGVSNFNVEHLERIIDETGVVPAVNQVELHPWFQQRELRAVHERLGIVTEAYSPLGQGELLADPTLARIAQAHGRTPAQAVLRWHVQLGVVAIPKTAHEGRLAENVDVFDFELSDEEMSAIEALDQGTRIGGDPLTVPF